LAGGFCGRLLPPFFGSGGGQICGLFSGTFDGHNWDFWGAISEGKWADIAGDFGGEFRGCWERICGHRGRSLVAPPNFFAGASGPRSGARAAPVRGGPPVGAGAGGLWTGGLPARVLQDEARQRGDGHAARRGPGVKRRGETAGRPENGRGRRTTPFRRSPACRRWRHCCAPAARKRDAPPAKR
jgi:hypothetical protein